MRAAAARTTGSRFLYEPFDATSARVETIERVNDERWSALERVTDERWSALETRLRALEMSIERLEKRMWMAAYAIATVVLSEGAILVFNNILKN